MEKREPFYTVGGECKLVQPLWKTVQRFLKKLKIELPYDPAILLLGIYLEKMKSLIQKRYMHPNVHSGTIYSKYILMKYFWKFCTLKNICSFSFPKIVLSLKNDSSSII